MTDQLGKRLMDWSARDAMGDPAAHNDLMREADAEIARLRETAKVWQECEARQSNQVIEMTARLALTEKVAREASGCWGMTGCEWELRQAVGNSNYNALRDALDAAKENL